ncbi:MAG: hypothetical protein ACE5FL_16125 [Myxococcota bacterium]
MPKDPSDRDDILPYGEGTYRRRILIVGEPGRVVADLEDDFHRFHVEIEHDGERVREVCGEARRFPWSECPGALVPLRAFRGVRLAANLTSASAGIDARTNCTHLYDLATLAVAHAAAGRKRRQYDVAVPDLVDERSRATLHQNGVPLLAWEVHRAEITDPPPYRGQALRGRAFLEWAEAELDAGTAEAAIVLRRGLFIANGRRGDLDLSPTAATLLIWAKNSCHSFTPGIAENALRNVGSSRDFTHRPEGLLADLAS